MASQRKGTLATLPGDWPSWKHLSHNFFLPDSFGFLRGTGPFRLDCCQLPDFAATVTAFLSSYLCRIRREFSSCSACPAVINYRIYLTSFWIVSHTSLSTRYLCTTFSIFDLWSRLGVWSDCWVSAGFFRTQSPSSLGRGRVTPSFSKFSDTALFVFQNFQVKYFIISKRL